MSRIRRECRSLLNLRIPSTALILLWTLRVIWSRWTTQLSSRSTASCSKWLHGERCLSLWSSKSKIGRRSSICPYLKLQRNGNFIRCLNFKILKQYQAMLSQAVTTARTRWILTSERLPCYLEKWFKLASSSLKRESWQRTCFRIWLTWLRWCQQNRDSHYWYRILILMSDWKSYLCF